MPDEHQSSRPGRSFTIGGWRPTGRFRIRSALFCFPVVEELRESTSGEFKWMRLPWMHSVEFKENKI